MTTTLVNTEAGHRKFYVVTIDGPRVHFKWGRIGTEGQFQCREFRSKVIAHIEAQKKIASKLDRGYVKIS